MKLIYAVDDREVEIGDICALSDDRHVEVVGIQFPHKPSSTGRVFVKLIAEPHEESSPGGSLSYFPSVINAKWINREDHNEK